MKFPVKPTNLLLDELVSLKNEPCGTGGLSTQLTGWQRWQLVATVLTIPS
ncbi:MAG: hypothetical protein QF473_11150 [Planctomycetota bacterium]|nr:hypothetical protein [Planctomycetota bacterium]